MTPCATLRHDGRGRADGRSGRGGSKEADRDVPEGTWQVGRRRRCPPAQATAEPQPKAGERGVGPVSERRARRRTSSVLVSGDWRTAADASVPASRGPRGGRRFRTGTMEAGLDRAPQGAQPYGDPAHQVVRLFDGFADACGLPLSRRACTFPWSHYATRPRVGACAPPPPLRAMSARTTAHASQLALGNLSFALADASMFPSRPSTTGVIYGRSPMSVPGTTPRTGKPAQPTRRSGPTAGRGSELIASHRRSDAGNGSTLR